MVINASNPEEIQEGVIEEEALETETAGTNEALKQSLSLDTLIKRYVADIARTQDKLKEQREMYNDAFGGDAQYHDVDEEVKALSKKRQTEKARITGQPAVRKIADTIKQLREELKEAQKSLSGYLQAYVESTGQKTIETDDGEVRQIVPSYKLVKKSS